MRSPILEIDKLATNKPINVEVNSMAKNKGNNTIIGDKNTQENQNIQGDNNIQGNKNVSQRTREQITATEVVKMLSHLEEKIQNLTALPEADREKSVKRLEAAKVEVQESEPDKESIVKSLKRVNETLNEAGKTTTEVKELVNELFPTVVKVAGYLGYAAGKIWMMLP